MAVFCLILSLAPIGALAATPAATLLFDLQIDEPTADGLVLSNKVADSSVFGEITYGSRNTTATNGYQEHAPIYSKDELGFNYLTFANYETASTADTAANRASAVVVALNEAYQDGVFANTQAVSYEIWARPNSVANSSSWGALFGVGSNTNNNSSGVYAYELRFTNGSGSFNHNQLDNGSSAVNTSLYSKGSSHLDKWTHYVLTREYDAANLKWIYKFYADGDLLNTVENPVAALHDYQNTSTTSTPINYLIIGDGAGTDRYRSFIGDIAEFRVYDGVLSETEVADEYKDTKTTYEEPEVVIPPMPDGLIFDMDISGSSAGNIVVADTSNAAQVKAITPYGASSTAPVFGSEDGIDYLSFTTIGEDGTTLANRKSKIAVELVNDNIADKAGVTFEAWARAKQTTAANGSTWGALASIGAANTSGTSHIEARFFDDGAMQFYPDRTSNGNGRSLLGNFVNSGYANEWKHYVFVREKVNVEGVEQWKLSLYVNGVLVDSENNTTAITADSLNTWLSIGGASSSDQSRAFIGDIADFRLYSKALTENEIKTSFNADANKYVSSDISIVWKNGDETLDSTVNIASLTSATAEVTVSNYAGTDPYIFVAAYKGKELVKVERAEFSISGTTVTATGTVAWEASDDVDAVKAFIWNDGLSPLCQPQGL